MEIKACPRCGSIKIFQGTIGDGVLTGYTSRQVCRNCGYQGMPLIFKDEKNYKKFLTGLKKDQSVNHEKQETENKEFKKPVTRPSGLYFLSALLVAETIISLFIFISNPSLFQIANVTKVLYLGMFMLTGIVLPIGFLTGSSWSFTVGGILFIFTIPFNLPLLYYITRPHVKGYLLREKAEKQRN